MASSSVACRACQRRVLETFASLAGLSLNATRVPVRRAQIQPLPQPSRIRSRTFQTSAFRLQQNQSQQLEEVEGEEKTISTSTSAESTPSTSSPTPSPSESVSDSSIPWYLRVEPPASPAPVFPHLASQEIPPLPDNAPELLEPILQHLSISIGLDNLTLLDLRDLTPPSALGANLLMVIGTARSHKHLNTSADRFCRWLRSTYKLRPFADGLLGRNELKLKLRRRNRRMKLAQSVGNTTAFGGEDGTSGYDSGITTGWICCNLGAVDAAVMPEERSDEAMIEGVDDGQRQDRIEHTLLSQKDQERILEDEEAEYKNPNNDDFKYRGFGSVSNAPRIVVQMFTEEKRLEMDLEGLWETRIQRRERKEQRQDQLFETSRIEDEIIGERLTVREDRS